MKRINCFNSLVIVLLNISCASPYVKITSNPEGSDVFVHGRSGNLQKIGKTPLDITRANVPELNEEVVQIMVVAEGFESGRAIIPKTFFSSDSDIHLNLRESKDLMLTCSKQDQSLQEVAKGVAEISNMLIKKDLIAAENVATMLKAKYPRIAVIHDLLGNIYYMKKDVRAALNSYKKSRELAPDNSETLRMIEKLSTISGESVGR